jgi:tripartite-type tricarboxylate transporter receptor subunit TctC
LSLFVRSRIRKKVEDRNVRKTSFPMLLLAALLASTGAALAQEYPSRLIRIVVPFPTGDGSDRTGRMIAEKLQAKWGQPAIVENRTGGGGNIGAELVAKAPPDGYTLMYTPNFTLVINKSLYKQLGYDPDAFVPVSIAVAGDTALLTHSRVPANSVQELIAYAKANPKGLNYASPGAGSQGHLIAEYFKSRTGVNITHVPYKGGTPALMDLLGGQVDMMFVAVGPTVQHVRAGRIRALAITGANRSRSLPEVPLLSETLPDFVFGYWFGMVAPPGTPAAITNRLSAAIAEALQQPDFAQRLIELTLEPVGSTPEKMNEVMRAERERWGPIVRTSGATAE